MVVSNGMRKRRLKTLEFQRIIYDYESVGWGFESLVAHQNRPSRNTCNCNVRGGFVLRKIRNKNVNKWLLLRPFAPLGE